MKLVVLVLDNSNLLREVLDAWKQAGAAGVTLLHSTGIGRIGEGLRDDVPLFPSLEDFIEQDEQHHRTLFTLVESDETAQRLLAATEAVVGDLGQPDTGLLFCLPVDFARGLQRSQDPQP